MTVKIETLNHVFAVDGNSDPDIPVHRVMDLCFTAFNIGDRGDANWYNDVMPILAPELEKLKAEFSKEKGA